ncbi:MAG: hypothetical protein ACPGUD_09300 [Parashewanella sp.]
MLKKILTTAALLASVFVCETVFAKSYTFDIANPILNLTVKLEDVLAVQSTKKGRLVHVSKEAYETCNIDEIHNSSYVIGEYAPSDNQPATVYVLVKKLSAGLENLPIYDYGTTHHYIFQDDKDSNQRCLDGTDKFTFKIEDKERGPKKFTFDLENPIPNLLVKLDDVIAVNSTEKGRLVRVSKEAFETCNIDAIKQSRLTIGDFQPKDGNPWTLYILVRKLHGGLDGIPTYKKGRTYYYIVQNNKNSNQRCLDGDGKFTFKTEGKEPPITQEDIEKGVVADIRMINYAEKNKHKHTGEYRVRSIDKDGRVKLSYLNGVHFNHTNVPSRRNKVFWVVMRNDVRYVYSGHLGWHAKDGGYAFLIRDNSSYPYPQVNSGFVIESID